MSVELMGCPSSRVGGDGCRCKYFSFGAARHWAVYESGVGTPAEIWEPAPTQPLIPHRLIFTHAHQLLETKEPRQAYDNVMGTIAAYQAAWGKLAFLMYTPSKLVVYS